MVLIEIGGGEDYAKTGLSQHGKFKINDLLDKFTYIKQRATKPNSSSVTVYEIFTKEKEF
jgi:hypothetical protein